MPAPSVNVTARYVAQDFFVYNTNHSAIAPNTTSSQVININADADFRVEKLTFFADIGAAGQTESGIVIPLVSVMIVDSGSGRQLMNGAIPVPALFGNGRIPFVMKEPKIFAARTSVNVTVSNFDASNTYNLKLAFIGTKLFLRG